MINLNVTLKNSKAFENQMLCKNGKYLVTPKYNSNEKQIQMFKVYLQRANKGCSIQAVTIWINFSPYLFYTAGK